MPQKKHHDSIDAIIDNKLFKQSETLLDTILHNLLRQQTGELKEYIDKRLDQHDKRFNEVDNRFDEVDKRFDSLAKKVDNIEKEPKLLVN